MADNALNRVLGALQPVCTGLTHRVGMIRKAIGGAPASMSVAVIIRALKPNRMVAAAEHRIVGVLAGMAPQRRMVAEAARGRIAATVRDAVRVGARKTRRVVAAAEHRIVGVFAGLAPLRRVWVVVVEDVHRRLSGADAYIGGTRQPHSKGLCALIIIIIVRRHSHFMRRRCRGERESVRRCCVVAGGCGGAVLPSHS